MEIDELMTFFCLIVGSRAYDDYETFSKIVDKALSSKQDQEIVIVSGGAKVPIRWQNATPRNTTTI